MIELLTADQKKVGVFQTTEELFRSICILENIKKLNSVDYFNKASWDFTVYSVEEVYELFHKMRKTDITEPLQKAYAQQLGLLEICQGDFQNPIQILLTPDLDMDQYKRTWCLAYCQAHGYTIVENEEGRP